MKGIGVDPDTFNLAYLGYGGSASALQNGTIDGMNTPAGVPVGAVTQAFAAMATTSRSSLSLMSRSNKPTVTTTCGPSLIFRRTLSGVDKTITTIAQPNFLAVRTDISEEDVYQLTKAMYENLAFLQGIHKATKDMAIEKAIEGLPMPLHAGAARYYQEVGIKIPAHLMPQ